MLKRPAKIVERCAGGEGIAGDRIECAEWQPPR